MTFVLAAYCGNIRTYVAYVFRAKRLTNLYTNISPFPVCLHVNEYECFYCHLTLFVRNKLIYRCFKCVR